MHNRKLSLGMKLIFLIVCMDERKKKEQEKYKYFLNTQRTNETSVGGWKCERYCVNFESAYKWEIFSSLLELFTTMKWKAKRQNGFRWCAIYVVLKFSIFNSLSCRLSGIVIINFNIHCYIFFNSKMLIFIHRHTLIPLRYCKCFIVIFKIHKLFGQIHIYITKQTFNP